MKRVLLLSTLLLISIVLFNACSKKNKDEGLNNSARIGIKEYNGFSLAYSMSNSGNWKFDPSSFTEQLVRGNTFVITAVVYHTGEDGVSVQISSYNTSGTVWYVDDYIGYFNGTPGMQNAVGPSVQLTVNGNTGKTGIFTFALDNMKSGDVISIVDSINTLNVH